MRTIDADKLPITTVVVRRRVFKNGRLSIENTLAKVVRVKDLEAAPTVVAEPVVRCWECEYCKEHPTSDGGLLCTNGEWNTEYSPFTKADGFCFRGKRKIGGKNDG